MTPSTHPRDSESRGRIRPGSILAFLVVGMAAAVGAACSDLTARSSPLTHARESPEALAQAALDALEARDDSALAALKITRTEYETLLWPELPDREHMPFEFVWSINHANSRKARRNLLSDFGGRGLELVEVELGEEVETYESFTLYLDARMTVRRGSDGEEGTIPLMDALVEMNGTWKFMNFRDDN